jgi:hypothetical protein
MEPTASFHLNRAIDEWLFQMRRKRTFRSDDLEELRSHLLDQTEDSIAMGMPPDEAFRQALRQLGEPDYLVAEYRKVNRWLAFKQRAAWAGRTAITSKRIAAFSLLFVSITFGSIFGQKSPDRVPKEGISAAKPGEKKALLVDTTAKTIHVVPAIPAQP